MTDCESRYQRRSGPGGQHRNKVETGVFVRHRPSGLEAQACERRRQSDNLAVAVERLRLRLAVELRTSWREPTDRWRVRCQSGRISVAARHADFAALLAEALDALAAHDWQFRETSAALGCTPSQLVKLLKREPPALALVNQHREQRGENALRVTRR